MRKKGLKLLHAQLLSISVSLNSEISSSYFFHNFLPNDKILDYSKFKVFADGKIIVTHKLRYGFGKEENIVGKGENAGYQHFLLFQQCFQKLSFPEVLKVGIVW